MKQKDLSIIWITPYLYRDVEEEKPLSICLFAIALATKVIPLISLEPAS